MDYPKEHLNNVKNHLLRQFAKARVGVTLLSKGANFRYRLFGSFTQQGRAIHATSVAYSYPSLGFQDL